jgi:hypothetical protein
MEENQERWEQLYAQAAVEHDPTKMIDLIEEIFELLEEKKHSRIAQTADGDYRLFVPSPASVQ